jgi:uncharacterized Zn finger protein (UPF0148 family)
LTARNKCIKIVKIYKGGNRKMGKTCPVCGTEVPEGEKICPECGTSLDEVAMQAPAEAVSPQEEAAATPSTPAGAPSTPQVTPTPAGQVSLPVAAARLLLKRAGMLTGDEFPIGESVVIGRFDEETGPVDVDLSNLPEGVYISRRHAKIYRDPSGQWFVEDLGSRNGTFLLPGGTGQLQKLQANQPTQINDGDEIAFGNARFIFRIK